uniref:Uncharacterized protein n=1 Tax=viral metagenome TaxID=1070528 RepID=A0A6C0ITS2_9ZZZZ
MYNQNKCIIIQIVYIICIYRYVKSNNLNLNKCIII